MGRGKSGLSGGGKNEGLTSAERDAVFDYTTSRYLQLNSALRSGKKMSKQDQKLDKNLESAMKKSKLDAGTTLYRGTNPDELGLNKSVKSLSQSEIKNLVGKTITSDAYTSTAKTRKAAENHAGRKLNGEVVIEYKNRTKRNGIDVGNNSNFGANEKEVILPKNAKFKITGAKRRLGALYVTVEW